jgi:hypothetical protein
LVQPDGLGVRGGIGGAVAEPKRFAGEVPAAGVAGQAGGLLHHVRVQVGPLGVVARAVDQQRGLLVEPAGQRLAVRVTGRPRALDAQVGGDAARGISTASTKANSLRMS